MDLSNDLKFINEELFAKGIKLRIEKRGDRLNLRGPLPCRDFKEKIQAQRISLNLKANAQGLKEAEKILHLIVFQIEQNQFDWKHWIKKNNLKIHNSKEKYAFESIKSFKKAFFLDPSRRRSESSTKTTWNASYLPYLKRLLQKSKHSNHRLDLEVFNKALCSYKENSRSKQQCATALGSLAKYLDLELPDDWSKNARGYGLNQARFRELPNDNLITKYWQRIPNKSWRLVYALMATYGLRNHEVFFCDLSSLCLAGDKVLRILPMTKTGEHQSWPFHPKWFEYFELSNLGEGSHSLPKINTDLSSTTLQNIGRRVSEQFRRYKVPFKPYDLRHAWAIRTIHIGLPDTVAARMMGHSVAIHTRTYHHWITRRDQQQAVDAALKTKVQ